MIPSPPCKERASKACVYLLRSPVSGTFYVGWTTNLKRRLEEHNSGQSRYTKSRGPWELIDYETFLSTEEAKKRERAFKHNPRMLAYFKKRALSSFLRNDGKNGMIPSPLYRPQRLIPPLAEKEVMG